MSVPKEKLHELIELIPDEDNEEVVLYLEDYIQKKQKKEEEFDPEEFRGALKHLNINVEEESRKLRNQWKRNIS
jgi:hypothetical protein